MNEKDFPRIQSSVEFLLFLVIVILIYGTYQIQNEISRTPEMQKVLKDIKSEPLK